MLGTKVGEVDTITILPTARIQAAVAIQRKLVPFIRSDSVVTIRKRFGVAGDAYLEIAKGAGAPLMGTPPILQAVAEQGPTEIIQLVVEELRSEIIPVIRQVRVTLDVLTTLFHNLLASDSDVAQFLRQLNSAAQRLERGEGSVGKLLADDTFADTLQQAAVNLNATIARLGGIFDEFRTVAADVTIIARDVRQTADDLPRVTIQMQASLDQLQAMLHDLKDMTAQLPAIANAIDLTAKNLPDFIMQSRETMRDMEKWLEVLQRHWLLGGARQAPSDTGRLTPLEALP
jgi:phospholipid/cholesterol/gamma-HCH transport system substrate-binding protein